MLPVPNARPRRITAALFITLAGISLLLPIAGCNNQKKQDDQLRQRIENQKQKSKAYPTNGSSNRYIP